MLACAPQRSVRPPDDARARVLDEATVGVDDASLRDILREHWAWTLEQSPLWATKLGVHDYDDRIGDGSEAAHAARARMRRDFLARLGRLDAAKLSERDRLTHAIITNDLSADVREEVCAFERWRVSASTNPIEHYNEIARIHPMTAPRAAETLLARVRAIPKAIDDEIAALRRGLNEGRVADAESIRRVVAMVDGQLATATAKWALFEPAAKLSDPKARAALATVLDDDVRPAFARYRALLHDELLPKARPADRAGIHALPDGDACYAAVIERHTTLPLTAKDVHARGLAEIARIDAEIAALGAKALGTNELATTLAKLRSDPALYFDTPESIEQAARDALTRAEAAIPRFFGRLPKAPCVVTRVPDYKAAFTTIAYYEPAHPDGSKPGEYFVNVLDPHTRPRYEARVLAVHESIPGHHLQIAIAQELTELPTVRRHAGHSAFVEGWALYTERLADEMGLYDTDIDRLGMLSFDAWRASRLVVDTGIHALGWSRAQAEQFMLEHTALAPNNIANEVDRYVGWPGQALAYKIGQLELLALRKEAEAALGERFSLPAFHDAILGGGAMPLPALRERVRAQLGIAAQ